MILHASITADQPKETAQTLGRVLGGGAVPMGPGEGTWMAVGPDPVSNIVEVMARGSEFHCIPGEHLAVRSGAKARNSGFHLLVESPLEEEEIVSIAAESGIPAHRVSHGLFDVIEFWVDGCTLIEIITPSLARGYRALFEPERMAEIARRFPDG